MDPVEDGVHPCVLEKEMKNDLKIQANEEYFMECIGFDGPLM